MGIALLEEHEVRIALLYVFLVCLVLQEERTILVLADAFPRGLVRSWGTLVLKLTSSCLVVEGPAELLLRYHPRGQAEPLWPRGDLEANLLDSRRRRMGMGGLASRTDLLLWRLQSA